MFRETDVKNLNFNPFTAIGNDWMLITAGSDGNNYNTMTASWGGMGVMWGKNVVAAFVRPSRHTYGFLEENDYFTLSFFGGKCRDALTFCGKHSGRDCDKARETGLIPVALDRGITFEQAETVFVLKKIYYNDINPKNFRADYISGNYIGDYHRMYVGEIVAVYTK